MLKNTLLVIISLCIGLCLWYIIRINNIWDRLPSRWSDIWYYHIEKVSESLSWWRVDKMVDNFIMSFFSPYYDRYSERNSINGLWYCSMIEENEKELPETLWIYIKVWNDIIYEWNRITSCTDCVINPEIPQLLFDGEQTFYRDILLSAFDYNNLTILGQSDVFTDKQKVYYQWIELEGMDWETFEKPYSAASVFKDNTYTFSVKPWNVIERIENDSWTNEVI